MSNTARATPSTCARMVCSAHPVSVCESKFTSSESLRCCDRISVWLDKVDGSSLLAARPPRGGTGGVAVVDCCCCGGGEAVPEALEPPPPPLAAPFFLAMVDGMWPRLWPVLCVVVGGR